MKLLARIQVALAVLIGLAGCTRTDSQPEPIRAVRTMILRPGSTAGNHQFAADIRARNEVRLAFRVPGKLAERSVDIGSRVKTGQILARLDPSDLQLSQEAARAATRSAEVALQLAQADYTRFKDLRDQGFISAAELDRREAGVRSATANFEQARAQARLQVNQAAYSALTATANGTVVGVDAEVGTVLAAGAPVVRIAADGPRDVVFSVPEDRVQRFRAVIGHPRALSVRIWGSTGPLTATLREVGAAADPATRTYLLKAELGTHQAELGQTATVDLPDESSDNVLRLPSTAVMEAQGRSAVWVFDRSTSTVRARAIQVAGVDGNEVIVKSGLVPDEVVVTAGVHVLTEGQKVKLMVDAGAGAATASRPGSGPAR